MFSDIGYNIGMRSVVDGLTNTIAIGEIAVNLGANGPGMANIGPGPDASGLQLNPSWCLAQKGPNRTVLTPNYGAKGRFYFAGATGWSGFCTVLPPNGPNCLRRNDYASMWQGGALNAESYHPGGVNVCMGDASGRFISETIDTGHLSDTSVNPATGQPWNMDPLWVDETMPSPYGVWGALGSKAGHEPTTLGN